MQLQQHPWGEQLCEEVGAEVDLDWVPSEQAMGTTALLSYPLIERQIRISASLLHAAGGGLAGQEKLLALIIEDADHALDPLRYTLCHYSKLQYLPNKAGWTGDFAQAYLMPEDHAFKDRHLAARPTVLRVSNNWLGLEVGTGASNDTTTALAAFVDGDRTDEMGLEINAALRAFGKAFYLVDLEAAFLHLIIAVEALCRPGKLRGGRHRIWVCACASGANTACFLELLKKYDKREGAKGNIRSNGIYELRNSLVHKGKSFAELDETGSEHAQFLQKMLGLTIDDLINTGITTRQNLVDTVLDRLRLREFQEVMATHFADEPGTDDPRLPIDGDKIFKRVIKHRTTDYPSRL